jgi:hypothetical protein
MCREQISLYTLNISLYYILRYTTLTAMFINDKCGSEIIAEILYGLPAFSPSLRQELRENKIVLGGCCVTGNDPTWKCIECGTYIYKLEIDFKDSVN